MIFIHKNILSLNNETNNLFKIILYERRRKLIYECPHCKSTAFIKYGKYSGIQRYKCKCCKRTFSLTTNSVWYYSKKKVDKWTNFIEEMLEKNSLRMTSKKLKISITTAFYWRHKIMDAACRNNEVEKLEEDVHILTDKVKENHKGSRNVEKYNYNYIWIVTAKGGNDKIISEPIAEGIWSNKKFNEKIYNKISRSSFITGYQNRYVYAIARKHNAKLIESKNKKADKTVENYMAMYKRWFSSFKGIATKYLKEYLNWFMMFYREKKYYSFGYMREIVKVMKYIRTNEIGH